VVEGRARTISVWLVMLAISLAAALAAASTGEKTEAAGAGKSDGKTEAKVEAKPESKGEAKPNTETAKDEKKGESKAEAKADTKKDEKTEAKAEAKKDAKPEAKKDAKAEAKKDAKATEKSAATKPAKRGKSGESAAAGEEQAGPLTPPLKLNALREEMSRPPARHDEHAATKAEREKLEQLAAEINKAREALRQDTAKLEAMLAARDAAPSPVASAGTPSNGENGEPVKKVPVPLDNLSKAIRGMKPEQAAPIISRVSRKLAADILLRMPGSDAGKVMGVCKPEVAAELAAEIASRTPHAELRR
jgi:flagellar motility protein MotE (MotC chaperone)